MIKHLTALALAASLSGCYTVTYDMAAVPGFAPNGKHMKTFRVEAGNNHFIYGLVTPNEVDVTKLVKAEVRNGGGKAARNLKITHQVTVLNAVLGAVTLGIYTPTTVIVEGDIVN